MSGTGLYEFTLPDKIDLAKIMFSGTVVANNDPLQLGRVQVTIDQLYDNVPQANLPWAIPLLAANLSATSTAGTFGIPDIGSTLAVVMLNGDPKYPAYIGSLWTTSNTKAESKTNYPNRYGFRDGTGNILIVDKTAGTVTFTHHTGSITEFDNSGNIQIISNKDTDITTENSGNFNLTVAGNVVANITGNANVTVNGSLTASVTGTTALTSTGAATWHVPAGLTITGNVSVVGLVSATQNIASTGGDLLDSSGKTMSGLRTNYNNHLHTGVSTGSSDTGTTTAPD